MTYCLAIKIEEGLVALADSRVTSGSQVTHARKAALFGPDQHRILVMTSGLRSVRDKTLAYLERAINGLDRPPATMLDAVGEYTRCLRQVAEEDREAIEKADLAFNLHALVCGRLAADRTPTIYLVYPEGNWVEVTERTPYMSIGATAYGKPILDRALRFDTPLKTALKLAYLSFDSTRTSSTDVGYPLDLMTLPNDTGVWREAHYEYEDLQDQRQWWNTHLTALAHDMPDGPWVDDLLFDGASRQRLSVVGDDKR